MEDIAVNKYGLCIEDCEYLEDKCIWCVVLSNGLTVFQDDDRSGLEPVAWKRLHRYCEEQKVDIIGMHVKFRSNVKMMPEGDNVEGYYFAYGAHREFNENITKAHYVCGYVEDGILHYTWYRIPELVKTRNETRAVKQEDHEDKKLISKHSFVSN